MANKGYYARKKNERTITATTIAKLIAKGKNEGFSTELLDEITLLVFSMI